MRLRLLLALGAFLAFTGIASAAPPSQLKESVGVCDWDAPQNCIKPNSDGSIDVTGSISATNPSVDATGAAVPAEATYIGGNKAGNLTGLTLDASSYLNVNCAAGCAGGSFNNNADNVATSADNGKAAAWLYVWDGAAWDRLYGNATDGALVNLGANNDVTVTGSVTANAGTNLNTSALALEATLGGVLTSANFAAAFGTAGSADAQVMSIQGIASMTPVTVSDGSGAMNVIVDSGTLTAVTTITNPVTVTDGAGSLNVIVDSGTLTAVTTITNPVTVTDGAGSLNVIVDSSALPSGAATEATLGGVLTSTNFANAFGTAGTADSQVMSVQGIASMTPLLANPGTAANWGVGATASAVPANGVYITAGTDGGLAAGTAASAGLIQCQNSVAIDTASSGNVELVALTSSETIYVCGYNFIASGTVDVQLIYGTGSACATGETNLTGAYSLTAQAGIVVNSPFWNGMKAAVSNALCIELGGAVQVSGALFYTKF